MKNHKYLVLGLTILGLAACAPMPSVNSSLSKPDRSTPTVLTNTNKIDSEKLAQEGIVYLQEGDIDKAQRLFNAAIKFDPEKSEFHLLLGMTYHLQYTTMHSAEDREKAEIGYTLASKYSPKSPMPWVQLGRLHAESNEYNRAVKDFSTALELSPRNVDALLGLSVNSYLTGDLKTALWSSDELEKANWDPKTVYYLRAIQFESIADHVRAEDYIKRLSAIPGVSEDQLATLKKQTDRIKSVYSNMQWLNSPDKSKPKSMKASFDPNGDPSSTSKPAPSSTTTPTASSKASSAASDSNAANKTSSSNGVAVTGSSKASAKAADSNAVNKNPASTSASKIPTTSADLKKNSAQINTQNIDEPLAGSKPKAWYECQDATPGDSQASGPNILDRNPASSSGSSSGMGGYGMGGYGMGYMGGVSTEDTSQLTAVPQPCVGKAPPKMAVIDAVLLRTEDQVTSSYGLNLLNGLNYFFGNTNTRTFNGSNTTISNVLVTGFGAAASATSGAAALAYSLNIANATTIRNEVVARPSLVAIDRMPSTFFSGNTLSIAVGGTAGGISSLIDKQVGVSFSITPTIVDDERIMLSVKAVRSFIEPPAPGTTGVALSQSRNAVTAAVTVKYGETIVLSGLNEREFVRADSGVPVLKDIPGVQYMFSNYVSTDFFRTVVIMVTPRKPVVNAEDAKEALAEREKATSEGKAVNKKYSFYWRVEDYEKILSKSAPNLDTVIENLESNNLYKAFRSKDLADTNWATKSRFDQMLHNLNEMLWH